jgi:hypothetical protein
MPSSRYYWIMNNVWQVTLAETLLVHILEVPGLHLSMVAWLFFTELFMILLSLWTDSRVYLDTVHDRILNDFCSSYAFLPTFRYHLNWVVETASLTSQG